MSATDPARLWEGIEKAERAGAKLAELMPANAFQQETFTLAAMICNEGLLRLLWDEDLHWLLHPTDDQIEEAESLAQRPAAALAAGSEEGQ